MRWVNISLRTAHLIGVAGVGGGFLYQLPFSAYKPYLLLLVLSGSGMLFLDIWCNITCLLQVRGIVTVIKIFILLSAMFIGMDEHILFTIIIISGVISHAPGKIRYYSLVKSNSVM